MKTLFLMMVLMISINGLNAKETNQECINEATDRYNLSYDQAVKFCSEENSDFKECVNLYTNRYGFSNERAILACM